MLARRNALITCVLVCMCMCAHVQRLTWIHPNMCVCMHIYAPACVHVCGCIHMHTPIHVYMHTCVHPHEQADACACMGHKSHGPMKIEAHPWTWTCMNTLFCIYICKHRWLHLIYEPLVCSFHWLLTTIQLWSPQANGHVIYACNNGSRDLINHQIAAIDGLITHLVYVHGRLNQCASSTSCTHGIATDHHATIVPVLHIVYRG